MQVSSTQSLQGNRAHFAIGRLKATTGWRSAVQPVNELDRAIAIRALIHEAEEYGADGLIDVRFEAEECRDCEIEGVKLRRLTATGTAVRLAMAA